MPLVLVAIAIVALTTPGCAPTPEDPAARDADLQLIAAAWANDVPRARQLIDDGADVNFRDDTLQSAFLIAASEGHSELLDLAVANGADVGVLDSFNGTALIRAAERGHAHIVERLLATDIDVDHVNNLGWTALHEAIIFGDGSDRYVRTIELLIGGGADLTLPTRSGQTPLELAGERGQEQIIEMLNDAAG